MKLLRSPLVWLVLLMIMAGSAIPTVALADDPEVYDDTVNSSAPPLIPGVSSIDREGCVLDGAAASWRKPSISYSISGGDLYSADVSQTISASFNEWTKAGSGLNFKEVKGGTPGDINVLVYPLVTQLFGSGTLAATGIFCVNGADGIQSAVIYAGVSINNSLIYDLTEVQNVLAHEIGHALGLGHSNNLRDLMYPFIDLSTTTTRVECPSSLDIAALTARGATFSAPSTSFRELAC